MSELIKQDINFMEYSIWMQDAELANKVKDGYVWEDREGYIYRAGYKPPVKTDFVFLLCMLYKSQQEGWKDEIFFTKYEILNACGISENKWWYERLEDSLERWKCTSIKFEGKFYDGKEYKIMNFGIIDDWDIEEETKKIRVRFAPKWLLQIKNSNYFKYINFKQVKALRSPLVIRLYEILVKSFQTRNKWEIDAMKLADKIPMNEKYIAHIIPKIKAGANRINEHTDLKIKLTVERKSWGKAKFIFIRIPNEKAESLPATSGIPEDNKFKLLVTLLPKEHQEKKTILELMGEYYHKHGYDHIARNINYANKNCRGNYRAYLLKSIREDWGIAQQEDEEAKKKAIERASKEQERRELESKYGEYLKDCCDKIYDAMTPEEQKKLNQEIREDVLKKYKDEPYSKITAMERMEKMKRLKKMVPDIMGLEEFCGKV